MTNRDGSLQERIASGKAEPISERERAQLEELYRIYESRFGEQLDNKAASKTG
ncbi:hypothetical protein GW570_15160 (plasmid) [Clavibacter capsici]|uniref:Uncharacterized protein n=1 Tax=Clavibacter capsici TaxID=1874630 RepID=A0AAE7CD60_9MICO|nr:hypothetical protein [Clavibacter capsici]QIS46513.1 hypothetical protein GW570_15160 [Clavibacter capsici]